LIVLELDLVDFEFSGQIDGEGRYGNRFDKHLLLLLGHNNISPSLRLQFSRNRIPLLLEINHFCVLLDYYNDEINEINCALHDQIVQIYHYLVYKGLLSQLFIQHEHGIENGIGLLVTGELFKFGGSYDDRIRDSMRIGLINL
jgi:hypothetical protein